MSEIPGPTQELLLPENVDVLLLPQVGSLLPHSKKRAIATESESKQKGFVDPGIVTSAEKILTEYFAILEAFGEAYDPERTILIQTDNVKVRAGVHQEIIYFETPPDVEGYKSIRLNNQTSRSVKNMFFSSTVFPRDLFSSVNGEYFFVDHLYSPDVKRDIRARRSPLGEGGRVLSAGKSIIVAPELWEFPSTKADIDELRRRGYKVAPIPLPIPDAQPEGRRNFVDDHIDGHAALIMGKDRTPRLLYAKSYAKQGAGVSKQLRAAAGYVGAEAVEIEDRNIPLLSFNFVQFDNGKVVMTSSDESTALQEAVSDAVGSENLIVTRTPITEIGLSRGGIRCMTNVGPSWLVNLFNPVPPREVGRYASAYGYQPSTSL